MLKLHDTMSGEVRPVEPLEPGLVKMYTCGPTVYRDVHIGNLRSYLMADWIRRVLLALGLEVKHVKNITDVGHMRQEMLEQGEDKVIAAALAEGKTPTEIAAFYTDHFMSDERRLNILQADVLPKATEHVEEMVAIVDRLVSKGLAYEVQGNVYFDVSAFPAYGVLSGNVQEDGLLEGVRVEADPLKQDPRDFALWKAAEEGRDLRWPSPWGDGFPGWHIECSAMSIKHLGERFDIHTGGVDNIFPHHEDEIAQSEGFTGERVVNSWVHGQHLLADGVKMAKSSGNSYTLMDIENRRIEPLAFRYLCLTVKYNARLNFTFTSLKAAARGLLRLRNRVWEWESEAESVDGYKAEHREWEQRFFDTVSNDLDLPGALALTWELAHSALPPQVKLDVIGRYDAVLGLDLLGVSERYAPPSEIQVTVAHRSELRAEEQYREADSQRGEIEQAGYVLEDTVEGTRSRPKTRLEKFEERWSTVSSSAEVDSYIGEPDLVDFTVGLVAANYKSDVQRAVNGAIEWANGRSVEVVVLDNDSTDGTSEWLEEAALKDDRVRVTHADHQLGAAAAMNIVLKQSRGETVVLMDTSAEVTGDVYSLVEKHLANADVGVTGPFGLRTSDLHHFHDSEGEAGDMDAMQAYFFAFKRSWVSEVGLMRESFRFYRNLDIDYSFQFKEKRLRIWADPTMPVTLHEHRGWTALTEAERDELSLRNYRRFLHRWGDREDLLVANQARV